MAKAKRRQAAQVGIRELRLNLSTHLERVKEGARLEVTEHGRAVALLVPLPPPQQGWREWVERMVADGRMVRPEGDPRELPPPLPPPAGSPSSANIFDELRADRI